MLSAFGFVAFRLVGRSVRNLYTSCLVQRFVRRFFPAVVPHEGYGAMFFVSDVLPASALRLCGACAVLEGTVLLRLTSFNCLGRFLLKPLLVLA